MADPEVTGEHTEKNLDGDDLRLQSLAIERRDDLESEALASNLPVLHRRRLALAERRGTRDAQKDLLVELVRAEAWRAWRCLGRRRRRRRRQLRVITPVEVHDE